MAFESKYSPEFKRDAVVAVLNRGEKTIKQIAEELSMNELTLKNWMRDLRHEGPSQIEDDVTFSEIPSQDILDRYRCAALSGILASDLTTRAADKVAMMAEQYAQEMWRVARSANT
jgi:transposase-like protein